MMRQSGKEKLSRLAGALPLAALLSQTGTTALEITGSSRRIGVNPLTGVARDGLDPVSYLTESEPMPDLAGDLDLAGR